MNDDLAHDVLSIAALIFLLIYFIPTVIAFYRGHPNRWVILLVNAVFASTIVGYFGTLIWALHAAHRPKLAEGSAGGESGLNLTANDPVLVRIAHRVDGAQTASNPSDRLRVLDRMRAAGQITADEHHRLVLTVLDKA